MLDALGNAQRERLQQIALVVFDVDGVLTDGQLNFLADGREIKSFSAVDGLGIRLLQRGGLKSALLSERRCAQVELRAETLGISHLRQGCSDKLAALHELWQHTGLSAEQTAFMGDDLPDLAALRAVGFAATVPSAHWLVHEHAHWCSQHAAGAGACREFCELILAAQGKLDQLLTEYL